MPWHLQEETATLQISKDKSLPDCESATGVCVDALKFDYSRTSTANINGTQVYHRLEIKATMRNLAKPEPVNIQANTVSD